LILFLFYFLNKIDQIWNAVYKRPNFTMFASEPNQNPSCEIIFFLNEKLNPNGASDPQFSIDPKYKQVCPPKERKKIKITVIMYYVQFTQLPPPLGPPFFSYKVYLLSSPVCSVRIRQNPAKYNY
jgi:hypothetical protein